MSQLIIEVDSDEDEALLLKLLPKFNARLVEKRFVEGVSNDKPSAVDVMEKIASAGGIASFGEASSWQRETRTDRPLPGRNDS